MTLPDLSHQDRQLLDLLQQGFPVVPEPFAELARRLGSTEDSVLDRVAQWRENGVIRRLGAVFDSWRLGYRSSLVAMSVPPERIAAVADAVNARPGVTHNYLRESGASGYNLWFTLTVAPDADLEAAVSDIVRTTGIADVLILPATRLHKIKVQFNLSGGVSPADGTSEPIAPRPASTDSSEPRPTVDATDWRLIRELGEDLPVVSRPFGAIGAATGVPEEEVILRIRRLLDNGVMRRFGATLKHYAVGFQANAMVVWRVPAERTAEVGRIFAGFEAVSHCYERPTYPKWPYNMYTMIHCASREDCFRTARELALAAGVPEGDYELLFTERELKKDRMRYGR